MEEKPKTQSEMIKALWQFCFNELPHKLKWQNTKLNFVMGLIALILALIAIVLAVNVMTLLAP